MTRKLALYAILVAAIWFSFLLSIPASAATCVPNKALAEGLKNAFGEVLAVAAMTRTAPLMIFSNPDTGTFTAVMVGPEASCVVASGTDFEIVVRGDPA